MQILKNQYTAGMIARADVIQAETTVKTSANTADRNAARTQFTGKCAGGLAG